MLEAAIVFGLISAFGEFVVLCQVPPRPRLMLLGNTVAKNLVHGVVALFNLYIHFGTVTGSMSAIISAIASFGCMTLAKKLFGYIENGRWYFPGWYTYEPHQVMSAVQRQQHNAEGVRTYQIIQDLKE